MTTRKKRGGRRPGAGRPRTSTTAGTTQAVLPADLLEALQARAQVDGVTQPEVTRRALREYLRLVSPRLARRLRTKEPPMSDHGYYNDRMVEVMRSRRRDGESIESIADDYRKSPETILYLTAGPPEQTLPEDVITKRAKPTHGGRRAGAGRKPVTNEVRGVRVMVRLSWSEMARLEDRTAHRGPGSPSLVREALLRYLDELDRLDPLPANPLDRAAGTLTLPED